MNKLKPDFLPLVSIQILNWNRAEDTQEAIRSAYNQTYAHIEVILIDNGSTDNSVALSRSNFPDLVIVELDKNYGCPGGRNKGIEYCNGDYIFYLDNDGVLHEEAVKNAMIHFYENPLIGVVTGTVYDFDHRNEIDAACEIRNAKTFYHNNFQGGICIHKKEIYKKTGLYPPHFMYGAEEYFLTHKLFDNNYKIIKDTSIVLWHKKSDVARNRSKEQIYAYFNKLYVATSLFPSIKMFIFIIGFTPKYTFYALKNGFAKEFLKGYFKNFFSTLSLGLKNRAPIKLKSYNYIKNFKPVLIEK